MEKLPQWFTRTPSPAHKTEDGHPRKVASPHTPARAGGPEGIHWSPYVWLSPDRPNPSLRPPPAAPQDLPPPWPGIPEHLRVPDLSVRKRLVRLPTGDDVLLVGDGAAGVSSPSGRATQSCSGPAPRPPAPRRRANGEVRRNLQAEFAGSDGMPTPQPETKYPRPLADSPLPPVPSLIPVDALGRPRTRGRERKHSDTPPPVQRPTVPSPSRPVPVTLQPFLALDRPSRADYAALCRVLLGQAQVLAPQALGAFAQVLAQRVMRAAPSASRAMVSLIEHLLSRLEARLPHAMLGALTHGLAQACRDLQAEASPGTRRGMAMARDHLSRHVDRVRDALGPARHAVQVCALSRVAGTGQALARDGSPQAFGRLLARDPVLALWFPDDRFGDLERLALFHAALALPPGAGREAGPAQRLEQVRAKAPAPLRGRALAVLLDAAGDPVPPGGWPLARLGVPVFLDMLEHRLRMAVQQWIDAVDLSVRECEDPAASPLADRALQARQARALDEAVEGLAACILRFDAARDPVFLQRCVVWLRAAAAPGAAPEVAEVAGAVADALARRAQALSAPRSPARL